MPWWGWMILGALLLGSELMIVDAGFYLVDAGFYLVFIGMAAALTGLVEVVGADLEPWLQWVVFSFIALMMMVLFRKKLYAKLRGSGIGYEIGPAGEVVTVEQELQPGENGRLAYRGSPVKTDAWLIAVPSGPWSMSATKHSRRGSMCRSVVSKGLRLSSISLKQNSRETNHVW